MITKRQITTASLSIFIIAVIYLIYSSHEYPNYVRDAMNAVSQKMSYSYGLSECKASQTNDNYWSLKCKPGNEMPELDFIVYPKKNNHSVAPTSFYLIADNDAAKAEAVNKYDLLTYLMFKASKNEIP